MPQMANIVIKKADKVTDVTWTAKTPSAGDKSPAVFKNDTVGTVLAQRPTFTVVAADNGTRKARRIRTTTFWPKSRLDSAGNIVVVGGASSEKSTLIPQDMTASEIAEFVYQDAALHLSALLQAVGNEGYAPS